MSETLDSRINVGMMVEMRKSHPCGKSSFLFEVLYIGTRIELKCIACSHRMFLDFDVFNRKLVKIVEEN